MISKSNSLAVLALTCLVFTIYVMRQEDLSFLKSAENSAFLMLEGSGRILAQTTSELCADVSYDTSYSDSDKKKAEAIRNALAKLRGGNKLEVLLDEGTLSTDSFKNYFIPIVAAGAVWAVLFFITIFICIGFCCNWCCMYGCCKGCKACRCCKQPQGTSSRKRKVYIIVTSVFLLALFATGIAGIVFSSGISKGMKVTYCSLYTIANETAYGKTSEKWLGLTGVVDSIDKLLDDFTTTVNSLNNFADSYSAMDTAYTDAKSTLSDLATNYGSSTKTRPDPAASSSTYTPDFISNLGDTSTSASTSSYIYLMLNEMTIKRDAMNSYAPKISDNVATIKSQQTSISSALGDGKDVANDIKKTVTDILGKLDDHGTTVNTVIKSAGLGAMGIFIIFGGIAILAFLFILFIVIFKIKFFNKLLHLSWCIMIIITILGFLFSTILFPMSIVMVEFCDVVQTAIGDQTEFTKLVGNALDSTDSTNLLSTCIFGDGKSLESLGVADQIGYFDTIYSSLDSLNAVIAIDGGVPASVTIPLVDFIAAKYGDGKYIDSSVVTDLATLNTKTNHNSLSCTTVYDTWVLNSANCSSGATIWALSDDPTSGRGSAICIPMNAWLSAGHSASDRYTSTEFPSSCAQINSQSALAYVKDFVDNLKTNRNDLETLFTTNLEPAIGGAASTSVKSKEAVFATEISNILTPISSIKTNLQTIQDELTGEENGLIPNTNCKYIGTGITNFSNAFCYGFITSLYQATALIIIVSVFSFFGTISVFCLAKRILDTGDSSSDPYSDSGAKKGKKHKKDKKHKYEE